ncbi:MAG TPA: winged helix-turn-helix domain-containing protein [Solirubrobacteraceae bacterium]
MIDQRIVKALAHPLRIRMLTVLNQRVASPSELAGELEEPIGNVSYHMRTLADLGMVELVRTEPRRGAVEHYYRAIERPHVPASEWATLPASVRRSFSDATGRQVLDDFTAAGKSGGFEREGARLNRLELKLDQKGWEELGKVLDDAAQRVEKAAAKAKDRKSGGGDPVNATAVLMLFETGTGGGKSNKR